MLDRSRIAEVFEALANKQREGSVAVIGNDAWDGRGPGRYLLPRVSHLHIEDGSPSTLPRLFVNAQYAGYLHGGSDVTARIFADMVSKTPHPVDITLHGHYANTAFYIDRLEMSGLNPRRNLHTTE